MNKSYLETLRASSHETKSLWHKIFAGTAVFSVVMWGLMLFPSMFGFTLFVAAFGFMTLGIKSYTLKLLTGGNPPIEHVFSKWRRALPAFCLLGVKTAYTFLWGLCFIVPGVIACLNYSLAFYVMCEDDGIDAFSAIAKSKKLVYGFRGKLFFLFLLYTLLVTASLCLGGGVSILLLRYTAIKFTWALFIGSGIMLTVVLALVMPFMHITYASVYLEAKAANDAPQKKHKRAPSKKKTVVPFS